MAALLLALILGLILDQGTASQRVVARMGERSGPTTLVIVLLTVAIASVAALSAALGEIMADILPIAARTLFLAIALLVTALSLFASLARPRLIRDGVLPGSVRGILHIALRRTGENSAFVLTGIATFTGAPILTAVGGTIGGLVAFIAPLSLGRGYETLMPLRAIQLGSAVVLLCAGVLCGASALQIL